jgi:hypothetical protein
LVSGSGEAGLMELLAQTIKISDAKPGESVEDYSKRIAKQMEEMYSEMVSGLNALLLVLPLASLESTIRINKSGEDLIVEKKVSGTWTTAFTIEGS